MLCCVFACLLGRWRQLDEEWFKPWFGGLPRTPTALEQRHKVLQNELAQAEAKLSEDQRTAVAAEELVGSLELEVADLAKQINLVQRRAREQARQKAASDAAANAAQAAQAAQATAAAAPPRTSSIFSTDEASAPSVSGSNPQCEEAASAASSGGGGGGGGSE